MEAPKEERWKTIEEEGFAKLEPYDMEGLMGTLTASTEKDHRLIKDVKIYQIQGGEIVPVTTGWVKAPLIPYEDFDWFK